MGENDHDKDDSDIDSGSASDSDIEYIGIKTAQASGTDVHLEVHQINRGMSRMTVSPAPISNAKPTFRPLKRKSKPDPDTGEVRGRKSKSGRKVRMVRMIGEPYVVIIGLVVGRGGEREKGEEARYASVQIGNKVIKVSLRHCERLSVGGKLMFRLTT